MKRIFQIVWFIVFWVISQSSLILLFGFLCMTVLRTIYPNDDILFALLGYLCNIGLLSCIKTIVFNAILADKIYIPILSHKKIISVRLIATPEFPKKLFVADIISCIGIFALMTTGLLQRLGVFGNKTEFLVYMAIIEALTAFVIYMYNILKK